MSGILMMRISRINLEKIINFKKQSSFNGYSQPVKKTVNKKQLLKKLYSLPKQPKAIPYITSYYKKIGCFVHHIKKKGNRKTI